MFKRIVFIVCIGIFFFGTAQLSYSQREDKDLKEQETARKVESVNVGNMICPVSGEKVGQGMEAVTYEYKGKIYNFCCALCVDDFKKDPEKYIEKIAEELQAKAQEKSGK
ncbi:MAG: YHS domain-containing protein [Candidatus Omnitrophota bacterium]